jgi:hypothetical protein
LYNWSKQEAGVKIAFIEVEMPQLDVRFISLIVGLLLLLVVTLVILNKTRDFRSCLLPFLVLGLIWAIGSALGLERPFQCGFKAPDQIRLAGHLRGNSPNDYLVLLYKGDQEIDRFVTRKGQLESEDQARDGYFELMADNEFELNRCSMAMDFEQDRAGFDLLWMQNKTTYLSHDFTDLGAGAVQPLNDGGPNRTYTLVISADRVSTLPKELVQYSTYRDRAGNLAINVPIKTYRLEGNATVESPTGFYTHSGRLQDTPQWPVFDVVRDVKDAWVVDSNPFLAERRSPLEPYIFDRDNCTGEQPMTDPETVSLVYLKEVQFQENTDLNFNLAVAASQANRSLGFTQGQMGTVTASVPVYVPPKTYRKYKFFWHDVWSTGTMVIDFGLTNIRVPYRARTGMSWDVESYDVDCPQ